MVKQLKKIDEEENEDEDDEEESREKTNRKAFEKTNVAIQTAPAVLDVKNDKILNVEEALVEILNKLDRIERTTG